MGARGADVPRVGRRDPAVSCYNIILAAQVPKYVDDL